MLVTIYITTFNRLYFLRRAIYSVLNQSYKNIEVLIVDDCSSDGTQEFLKEISKQDHRIKFFLKEKNGGACESRNIAIKAANGKYITGLDDDDFFLPNRVENFVNNIVYYNNAILLYDNPIIKSDNSLNIGFKTKFMNFLKPNKVSCYDLLFNNYIGNQVFIRTDIIRNLGGFDINMPMWQDMECWYNILANTEGSAIRLKSYTYVVDISHDMGRISNFKISKGEKAYTYFSKKHLLNREQSILLCCHLYGYDKSLIKLSHVFFRLKKRCNFLIFLNTLKFLYLYLKR